MAMSFEEQYPKAVYLEMVTKYGDIMKGNRKYPCWQCGELTSFLEVNFEAYTCSDACAESAWREYDKATFGDDQDL